MSHLARTLALAALLLPAAASAAEYRLLTTSDGRVLPCEVQATEAAGLRVSLPQGQMLVPFAMLRDMVPITEAEYEARGPWYVYIPQDSPFRDELIQAVASIPSVQIIGETAVRSPLSTGQERAAADCGVDLTCISSATSSAPWMWMLLAADDGTIRTALNSGASTNAVTPESMAPDALRQAVVQAFELGSANELEPRKPPKPDKPPKTPKAPRTDSSNLAWVPVPGLVNLQSGDAAGFGMAMGVALPATALWVGAVGHGTQSTGETVALGALGFYAITVVTNHALEGRTSASDRTELGVVPTQEGGASLMISVPLK